MKRDLKPSRNIGGTIRVPGDKSIAHRVALLSILSEGPITVFNCPHGEDCKASLEAAQNLGVSVEENGSQVILTPPARISCESDTIIDCGNSGTTARLLAGLVSGTDQRVILSGDESLSSRPMKRLIDALKAMGAEVMSDDEYLPLTIQGTRLLPFEYMLPVPSAQLKSALLLAGLASHCTVTIQEKTPSRDHTEVLIQELGEGLSVRTINPVAKPDPVDPRKKKMVMPEPFKKEIVLNNQSRIRGGEVDIPGDLSTAAYFMAAAAISGSTVTVENVGLNPTRADILTHLKQIGCKVEVKDKIVISGEPRGTVTVTGGKLKPRRLSGDAIVGLIDELPIVAVMAAFADGTTVIRDAAELRVKESDRLVALADNLSRMGVKCGVMEDGIAIEGTKDPGGADFANYGDHRIAMSFSIASLFLDGPSTIDDDAIVAVSCPEFYELLDKIVS